MEKSANLIESIFYVNINHFYLVKNSGCQGIIELWKLHYITF